MQPAALSTAAFLTAAEAASRLGCSAAEVRRIFRSAPGNGLPMKVSAGGQVRRMDVAHLDTLRRILSGQPPAEASVTHGQGRDGSEVPAVLMAGMSAAMVAMARAICEAAGLVVSAKAAP